MLPKRLKIKGLKKVVLQHSLPIPFLHGTVHPTAKKTPKKKAQRVCLAGREVLHLVNGSDLKFAK